MLIGWSSGKKIKVMDATHIRIRKGYTAESFTRKITDRTEWGEQIIISWNPNEEAIKQAKADGAKDFATKLKNKFIKEEYPNSVIQIVIDLENELKEAKK